MCDVPLTFIIPVPSASLRNTFACYPPLQVFYDELVLLAMWWSAQLKGLKGNVWDLFELLGSKQVAARVRWGAEQTRKVIDNLVLLQHTQMLSTQDGALLGLKLVRNESRCQRVWMQRALAAAANFSVWNLRRWRYPSFRFQSSVLILCSLEIGLLVWFT